MGGEHFNKHWWTPPPRHLADLNALIIDTEDADLNGTVCKVIRSADDSRWVVRTSTGLQLIIDEKSLIPVESEPPPASAWASGGQVWATGAQVWASSDGGVAEAWAAGGSTEA